MRSGRTSRARARSVGEADAGRQVRMRGKVVGYYYFNRGTIGPAAWKEAGDGESVLSLACREAMTIAPTVRVSIPGINHLALRFALDCGLRLTSYAHLLTTGPFGRLEQYVPSGPMLFRGPIYLAEMSCLSHGLLATFCFLRARSIAAQKSGSGRAVAQQARNYWAIGPSFRQRRQNCFSPAGCTRA